MKKALNVFVLTFCAPSLVLGFLGAVVIGSLKAGCEYAHNFFDWLDKN